MIVKMNKYAYLVYHKEYDAFLEKLRSMGVVHIKCTKSTAEHSVLQKIATEKKRIQTHIDYFDKLLKEEAKKQVQNFPDKTTEKSTVAVASPKILPKQEQEALIGRIENLHDELNKSIAALSQMEKEKSKFFAWGDFSYAKIAALRDTGYEVSFFTCPKAHYDEAWETEHNAFVIGVVQSLTHFITVTPSGESLSIDADEAVMPESDYAHLEAAIDEEQQRKENLENELLTIAQNDYRALLQIKAELEDASQWNNALVQTASEVDEKLMFLQGWVPENLSSTMEKELTQAGYYCREMEITDEDIVPIKLKNGKFARLFEPITNLYSLPNYKELDQTPLFAPFFMLFFGLCFGDGGYGLLMLIIATLLKRKAQGGMKPILLLTQYFGLATIFIGILTGTFFGIQLVKIEAFSSVRQYFLSSDNLMVISLVIGFIHILFAKTVAAYKIKIQRGFRHSLASFAWIFVILSLGAVLILPSANIVIPQTLTYILYGVAILFALIVLFYNTPGKNIFINFGTGIWNTYNMVSGLVGDVLSYIRLYAIGLTSALLGGVFNSMAIDMTASLSPFIRWLPVLLILLLGHALNIGLSLISSFVHPLRLVYVEYFKNAGFEGGGSAYQPFKKISNNK